MFVRNFYSIPSDVEMWLIEYDDYQKAQLQFEAQLNNSINQEPDEGCFLIQKK